MRSVPALLATAAICSILLIACETGAYNDAHLQLQIDSIKLRLSTVYQPGMGDLMSTIQLHHAKLWFAGKNGNWPLANYDASLITSNFMKIQKYHGGTFEAKAAFMIDNPMDSVRVAIILKDSLSFQRSFTLLTTTCNTCHAITKHPYNLITIPNNPPVGNQDFSLLSH
jgi:cytochrome c1